jgi:hypothetical protein
MKITSKSDHRDALTVKGFATRRFQLYLDDITQRLNDFLLGDQVRLTSYTVATLPDVPDEPGMIFVSDETGGAVMAFSDGTNWLRCTDRAIVS